MAAELLLVAAALVATNIHTHTHDTNHTSMRALAHAGSSPILTLSHHIPTPLSPRWQANRCESSRKDLV